MSPQRREAGIRRRLRLPWVRAGFREKAAQEAGRPAIPGRLPVTYGVPWTAPGALAKYSFACRCHKGPRFRDVDRPRLRRAFA